MQINKDNFNTILENKILSLEASLVTSEDKLSHSKLSSVGFFFRGYYNGQCKTIAAKLSFLKALSYFLKEQTPESIEALVKNAKFFEFTKQGDTGRIFDAAIHLEKIPLEINERIHAAYGRYVFAMS
jgi:hypothetical protein